MRIKKALFTTVISILITGCIGRMPNYKESSSSFITFKTPTVKYADMGFISKADRETKVEIYSNGHSVMRLRMTPNKVCMTRFACMSGSEFNKKVLNASYPPATLKQIFSGQEIFNGQNRADLPNGFIQNIGSITYEVTDMGVSFKDSSNGVTIEVQNLNN